MSTVMTRLFDDDTHAEPSPLNARQRLAASRSELVRHMSGDTRSTSGSDGSSEEQPQAPSPGGHRSAAPLGTWGLVKLGIGSWWRHHPANMAVAVATPLLHRYAGRKPFQLLAISAGAGAAVVLLKPWRLISLGGLALATLKSSEFSGLVASLLSSKDGESDSADNAQDMS
jgi:hypothetical protein